MQVPQLSPKNTPHLISSLNEKIRTVKTAFLNQYDQCLKWSKKHPQQSIAAIIGLFILVIGGGASLLLFFQGAEIRNQASGGVYATCARGTPHNGTACDSYRSYVVCNNGLYGSPISCAENKICSDGKCINQEKVDCLSWNGGNTVKHGSCDDRNGIVQVCKYGVYQNPNPGECGTPSQPTSKPSTPPASSLKPSPSASPSPSPSPSASVTTQICQPNKKTCVGNNQIRVCNAEGNREAVNNCQNGQQCIDNECKNPPAPQRLTPTPSPSPSPTPTPTVKPLECTPVCTGPTSLRLCNNERTQYLPVTCAPGLLCNRGACVKPEQTQPQTTQQTTVLPPKVVCSAGKIECRNQRTLQTCSPNGSTWMLTSCVPGKECINSTCQVPQSAPEEPQVNNQVPSGQHTCYLANNGCNTASRANPCNSIQGEWDEPDLCSLFLPLDLSASAGSGLLGDAEMSGR